MANENINQVKSLDPRVTRLSIDIREDQQFEKAPLDQLTTFEVFVQPREGKPFQHEGSVHAPDVEMAFILAKETFTRRFLCTGLWVVSTHLIYVSAMTDNNTSVFKTTNETVLEEAFSDPFEIFFLLKRGKQQVHAGSVDAGTHKEAVAKSVLLVQPETVVLNVWAIRGADIRRSSEEEQSFWATLAEKKFRDASAYRGGDRLKNFISNA